MELGRCPPCSAGGARNCHSDSLFLSFLLSSFGGVKLVISVRGSFLGVSNREFILGAWRDSGDAGASAVLATLCATIPVEIRGLDTRKSS